ncbi:uncharacterized protein ASPGLDRAFT_1497696 [Aspergillus glaucus CBS 516.65]|uniref:Uncharacterized protein n=1 Tax=Aspergillus glaucus CBS 516.65 TaxID=1160497 RepID=A0A1L9VCE8_ASPGL|nr:hypothetical protein ASPGLDRAFT_1497696 [Aspergillus glaucus CBS 516.65]OJJ81596.1 hypothetical protein ASPGLDRAFT_1497696 [Aspergillus glaucus CBS 516.65]
MFQCLERKQTQTLPTLEDLLAMFEFLTKEKRPLRTLEDWLKGIKQVKDPLELTNFLFLNWPSFTDKVKVLISLPKTAIRNDVGMKLLESRLEDSMYAQLAQVVRWLIFGNGSDSNQKKGLAWSRSIIVMDIGRRRIVQREIYVQEEMKALQKSLHGDSEGATETSQLSAYEKELENLNNEYWSLNRDLGQFESAIPAGALSKAFKSWRADPDWYLCQWLREDCARRGGCCGRDCGCCEKARATNRRWNRGHCTGVCGCCVRTQGCTDRDVTSTESEEEDYPYDADDLFARSQYEDRFDRAYIWGLSFLDELDLLG